MKFKQDAIRVSGRCLRFFLIPLLMLSLANCSKKSSSSTTTVTPIPTSALTFPGISSISSIGGASMQVNWTPLSGAISYAIWDMTPTKPVLLATVPHPISSYLVTGLKQSTSYTFRVRLIDSLGLADTNSAKLSGTTLGTAPPASLAYTTPNSYIIGNAITTNSPTSTGGAATSYSLTPALPTGLSFSTVNGQITGTPTAFTNASYLVTVTNAGGSASASVVISVVFPGISSISNVSGTSMRLNWSSVSNAATYLVYNTTSGTPVFVTTVTAPATNYTVNGLSNATAYTFRVRVSDTTGATDTNTTDVSATTLSAIATFQGWTNIKAVGVTTPVSQSGISAVGASATLSWNPVTLSTGSVASYNIFRATAAGAENYAAPLASGISVATNSYTDSSVVSGTTYFYTIAPVVSGSQVLPATVADSEIKIIMPAANMVLIHRWAANQEICGLMGRAIDRTNNYRCAYIGPGGTGTYYDVGKSNLIDAYVLGCNYTAATSCGDAVNGCLGTADPAGGVGVLNNVFYNRTSGACWIKTGGSTWTNANSISLSAAARALMSSNSPGLPPLVSLDQNRSYDSCQALTATGFAGFKKLPTHHQQIIAGAWDSSLNDTAITNTQNGSSLNTSGYCNSNSGSGLVYDNLVTPGNLDTLPGTSAGGIRSVRTGSTATQNCLSRYGAQDMVGNVWQWSSDQLGACNAGTHTCVGLTSTIDATNTDWNGLNFDGTIGPGTGGANLTEWDFSTSSYSTTKFLVPLGIPMVGSVAASWDALTIGASAGQINATKLHGDHIWLYTDNGGSQRGAISGGTWYSGANGGRFSINVFNPPANAGSGVGVRCTIPAE